jgi:nucleotide-binding universal stress UspA family protein
MNAQARPTILVGVSGSPASAAALRWAATEAGRRHGRLRIVLILQPDQRAFYAPPAAPPDRQDRHSRARHDLDRTLRTVLGPVLPADATAQIVVGVPERALAAQSSSADLLVLGSGSGTVIGPVIRACLTGAHCPVLVVSPQAVTAASQRQPRRHIGGRPIHRAHSRRPVAAGAPSPRLG